MRKERSYRHGRSEGKRGGRKRAEEGVQPSEGEVEEGAWEEGI